MAPNRDRWWAKANAYANGWTKTFPGLGPAGFGNVVLGLAVAQGETNCGDAWPGEHNWGAVQRRAMNAQEVAVLQQAGIHASEDPAALAAAKTAIAEAIAAGTCPPLDHESLHLDSSPITGWYFAYYWAFDNDTDGAAKFIQILAGEPSRTQCEYTLIDAGSTVDQLYLSANRLALFMYQSHYYEGTHNPHDPGGAEANVAAYASNIRQKIPDLVAALNGWTVGATPPPPDPKSFDLTTILGVQEALNYLKVCVPPISEDGTLGPATKQAITRFQAHHGLQADGIVGPQTISVLKQSLGVP